MSWETPRNLSILVGVTVVVASALGGWVGYGIGQQSRQQPISIVFQPDAIQVLPNSGRAE